MFYSNPKKPLASSDRPLVGLRWACRLTVESLEDRCLLSGGINEFGNLAPPPGPRGITSGADSNLWFTEYGADQIGQFNPQTGQLTEIPLTPGSRPWDITPGLNGSLWFTENGGNKVGRIRGGIIDEITLHSFYTNDSQPMGIVADTAGRIWIAKSNARSLGVINPDDTMCDIRLTADPFTYEYPHEITLGTDGRLWFTGNGTSNGSSFSFIGWITGDCNGSHSFTRFYYVPNPSFQGITPGPDGDMWVLKDNGNAVVQLDSDISILQTIPISTANSHPREIVTGPDGSLWFTEYGASQIGRVTFGGDGSAAITEYRTPMPDSGPLGITVGPDGNIWFTENRANQIGQIVLDAYPLTATGTSLTETTGVPFTDVVASFSDSDPNPGPAANYSALINWGDGSTTPADGINDNGGGNFDVIGSHTYTQVGSYTVTETITDNDTDHDIGGVTTIAYSTVDVEDAGRGVRVHRDPRLVDMAGPMAIEPTLLGPAALAVGETSAESTRAGAKTITYPPLPTSALEMGRIQARWASAQPSGRPPLVVGRAGVADPLAPAALDGLVMDSVP
jgi:virginiamycin B lyase